MALDLDAVIMQSAKKRRRAAARRAVPARLSQRLITAWKRPTASKLATRPLRKAQRLSRPVTSILASVSFPGSAFDRSPEREAEKSPRYAKTSRSVGSTSERNTPSICAGVKGLRRSTHQISTAENAALT